MVVIFEITVCQFILILFTKRYRNSSLLCHGFSYYAVYSLVRYTGNESDASQTDIRPNNDDSAEPSLPGP